MEVAPGRGRRSGSRRRQGTEGGLSREDREQVEGPLATGAPAMRISEPEACTAMMVTTTGRSVCPFPRSQANRSTFTKHRDYSIIGACMVRDRGPKRAVFGVSAGNSAGNYLLGALNSSHLS